MPSVKQVEGQKRGVDKCIIEGCDNLIRSIGLCEKHYYRKRRHGSTDVFKRNHNNCLDKGGIPFEGKGGYMYVRETRGSKSKLEHRYIMEQHLGRLLTSKETVHHKNGDRKDNRLSNLELWSYYQPYGQRVEDKIEYAKEILSTYNTKEEIIKWVETL